MGISFEFNGAKASQDDLKKINQSSEEKSNEDQKDLVKSLSALKRVKEMKGEKLSNFLESKLESATNDIGKEGLENLEQDDDVRELNKALDVLEQTKLAKKEKQKGKEDGEGEKTKVCQKCGRETVLSSNFCPSCGNKLEENEQKKSESSFDSSQFRPAQSAEDYRRKKEIMNGFKKIEDGQGAEAQSESNVPKKWSESDLETAVKDENSLLSFLDKVDGIQGSGKYWTREELKSNIKNALEDLRKIDMQNKEEVNNILRSITNQGEVKLREKVYQIALREKLQGI